MNHILLNAVMGENLAVYSGIVIAIVASILILRLIIKARREGRSLIEWGKECELADHVYERRKSPEIVDKSGWDEPYTPTDDTTRLRRNYESYKRDSLNGTI